MSDDWENNTKPVEPLVKVDKWEGEDEDDDIKDNWDDEEDDQKEVEPTQDVSTNAPKISAKKKKLQKIQEKDLKDRQHLVENSRPKTAEEELADRLERQRLIEESDLALAQEAFGDSNSVRTGLDISLNTKEDFDLFRKSLVQKLLIYDKSPHFVNFLENLFRELCVSIETDDIKRLSNSLTALFNEKVKAQKAGTKSKKKGKGFSVRVERTDVDTTFGNNDYEDYDDFL